MFETRVCISSDIVAQFVNMYVVTGNIADERGTQVLQMITLPVAEFARANRRRLRLELLLRQFL